MHEMETVTAFWTHELISLNKKTTLSKL